MRALTALAIAYAVLSLPVAAQSLPGSPPPSDIARGAPGYSDLGAPARDPALDRSPANSAPRRLDAERRRMDPMPSPSRPLRSAPSPRSNPGRTLRPF